MEPFDLLLEELLNRLKKCEPALAWQEVGVDEEAAEDAKGHLFASPSNQGAFLVIQEPFKKNNTNYLQIRSL